MSDSCNPKDCSLPGSSVYGISQARILEWVDSFSFSGPSQLWGQTQFCIADSLLHCRQILYQLSHQGWLLLSYFNLSPYLGVQLLRVNILSKKFLLVFSWHFSKVCTVRPLRIAVLLLSIHHLLNQHLPHPHSTHMSDLPALLMTVLIKVAVKDVPLCWFPW